MALSNTPPVIIDTTPTTIVDAMIQLFTDTLGRELQPAQVERLLANALAYREVLLRQQVQVAGEQMLVRFSNAPVLDYLAENLGVTRLAAVPAKTTVRFDNGDVGTPYTVPAGTRITNSLGTVVFYNTDDIPCDAGGVITGEFICQTDGIVGNDYAIGTLNVLIDPLSDTALVGNTTVSGGGADQETDAALRARYFLAMGRFSNAGSTGAYKYWALSANPLIIDASVKSTVPGTVNVYILTSEVGGASTAVLDDVYAALNNTKIRPLSDTVVVSSAVDVGWSLYVEVYAEAGKSQATISADLQAAIQAYADTARLVLGQTISKTKLYSIINSVDGVVDSNIIVPLDPLFLNENEYPVLSGISVSFL